MNYLIDTCCISELVNKDPNPNVIKWFSENDELSMYLSVITFGELRKGVQKLPNSKKRTALNSWIDDDLQFRFKNRILNIGLEEVNKWGEILAEAEKIGEKIGEPMPAIDALIAASALVHDLYVVTRNVSDMEASGVEIINPWIS